MRTYLTTPKASPLVGEVGGGPSAPAGLETLRSPPPSPPHKGEGLGAALLLTPLLALTACAATQDAHTVASTAPGFWMGLWHGFIFPVAWIVSLFTSQVSIYAVPNNGGWYDFGYFLGIVVFGVGARKSHTVYRDRTINVSARRVD